MSLTPTTHAPRVDAAGTPHEAAEPSARIVSAVPSITELLFHLGLGAQVVGRTGFCIHPRDEVRKVARVGGTKTLDPVRIRRLALLRIRRRSLPTFNRRLPFLGVRRLQSFAPFG